MSQKFRFFSIVILICLSACGQGFPQYGGPSPTQVGTDKSPVKAYEDVRFKDLSSLEFNPDRELMEGLTFNLKTDWPSQAIPVAREIMEKGKNPGLGVRALHEQGITGKGVNVAIIDQNLVAILDHPEFKGKIARYYDTGTKQPKNESSMHGPAVASLLVGEQIGTAPEATLFYAAAPSWTGDAQYYADALDWIIDQSEQLPEGQKIRVVSVSAAPSGPGSPFKSNNKAWDEAFQRASEAGILVLDCTTNYGLTAPCYLDLNDPDNVSKCTPGFPGRGSPSALSAASNYIFIPTSHRTTAEEYSKGDFSYQYTGQGGLSWSIPYLAGVLAMGWQVNPNLTGKQILELVFNSAYVTEDGFKVINPPNFIDMVRQSITP